MIETLYWKNNKAYILNQLLLPDTVKYVECKGHEAVYDAIKNMVIRGAPAIGVAAGFGMALASLEKKSVSLKELKAHLFKAAKHLASSRPTAVNLFWALKRMTDIVDSFKGDAESLKKILIKEALDIYDQDIAINKKIGDFGAALLKKDSNVITHCNAGALATAGYGTALGVIRSGMKKNKINLVYVDETRPYLQGARLTAWEMKQEKIPYKLVTDNMAGHLMKTCKIGAVIVGADRIAVNGDAANKIGTYSLSILAKYHGVPFYVAAPVSTIDPKTSHGDQIVIEERSAREVLYVNGKLIAPEGTEVRHPAFDVTPAKFITAIITEKGAFKPSQIKKALQ